MTDDPHRRAMEAAEHEHYRAQLRMAYRRLAAGEWENRPRHRDGAAEAEKAGDAFQAAYHLGWLIADSPTDAALHRRRAAALARLKYPAPALVHTAAAELIDRFAFVLPAAPKHRRGSP
jgi:hypothetical protein